VVPVEDSTADVQELLFHLYMGAVDAEAITASNVRTLMRLAHKYDMPLCMRRYDSFVASASSDREQAQHSDAETVFD
jgi:hypothetical protein